MKRLRGGGFRYASHHAPGAAEKIAAREETVKPEIRKRKSPSLKGVTSSSAGNIISGTSETQIDANQIAMPPWKCGQYTAEAAAASAKNTHD